MSLDLYGSHLRKLDGGGAMFAPIRATFNQVLDGNPQLRLTIEMDVEQGVPICRRYTVERFDGGLELMTAELMRGVNLRRLMAQAAAAAALEKRPPPPGVTEQYTTATSVEAVEAVVGPIRRRRVPVTDKELRRFADMYRRKFVPGRMAEFAEALHYSERHAYRLKRLAIERGFLTAADTKGRKR
jgi:hypothetical protein